MKEELQKSGSWIADKISYFVGMVLYMLFCAVKTAFKGILGMFLGGIYIFIVIGVWAFVFCLIVVILGQVFK